jgi:hypothetical protein
MPFPTELQKPNALGTQGSELSRLHNAGAGVQHSAWRGWWLIAAPLVGAGLWYLGFRLVLVLIA